MSELSLDKLARFNDSQKRSFRCMIFGHDWSKTYGARVKGKQGVSLCELKSCSRCQRYKIGKILKKKLNRQERRR